MRPQINIFISLFSGILLCKLQLIYAQNLDQQWRKLDSMAMDLPRDYADSAKNYALKALEIAKQNNNQRQLAITYHNLGLLSNEVNDFEKAIAYLEQGLKYVYNDTLKAAIYTDLGRAYDDSSRPDSAVVYILKGLEINETLGPAYEARSLRKLAFSYRSVAEYERSLSFFKKALQKEKEAGLDSYLKRSYMNIGLLYHDTDRYDSAIYYFKKSYALIDDVDIRGNAVYNNNMASCYLKMGKPKKALPFAKENLNWKLKLGDQESLTYAYNILSDLHLQLRNYAKAKEYATKAMTTIDTFPASHAKMNAYKYLLNSKIMLRDTTGTLELLKNTLSINQELFDNEKAKTFAELTVQYEANKKFTENQVLKSAAVADDTTINNQYAVILAGSIVVILLVALVLIIGDRSQQNRLAHLQMSEQKEEIEAQRNQLEEMNRTKDRFFGIISHDLRGPVNAFQGLSALTRMNLEKGDQDQIPELLDLMDKSSNRLSTLLDNLLNWALTQDGSFPYSPEAFRLEEKLMEVLDIFRSSARAKGITLKDSTDPSTTLFADANGFKTIVRNLLNNAIKYSKKGDIIEIKSLTKNQKVCLQISDTGAGMSQSQLNHLFNLEKNQSSPGTAGEKGSGLGLVLCKELIELNLGKITVESELGKGTTFEIEFPAHSIGQSV